MTETYTVVAYWGDNDQPWVGWAEGESPRDAAKNALKRVNDDGENAKSLVVVAVLAGRHSDVLEEETTVDAIDLLNE